MFLFFTKGLQSALFVFVVVVVAVAVAVVVGGVVGGGRCVLSMSCEVPVCSHIFELYEM